MTPSLKAVLARFNGDREKARQYCTTIAEQHPRLAAEYKQLAEMLRSL